MENRLIVKELKNTQRNSMPNFDKDYIAFFKELEKNNNKDWFDANRKRYENSVKKPFKAFMVDLAEALGPLYGGMDLSENFKIMRINRDIRFSADKTPYKIHMAGMVSAHGKSEMTKPGVYVQANHADVRLYSGAHGLDKDLLYDVREHITNNLQEFNKLIGAKAWKETYGEILGEKNKRLPKEFQAAAEEQPLLYNKSFYWFFKLKPAVIVKDELIPELVKNYKKTLPLNEFFEKALR